MVAEKSGFDMKVKKLEEAVSTNSWVSENEHSLEPPVFVYCHKQTAGRGQRGNSWESETGKNVTGSLIFYPEKFHAASQFLISEAIALSVVNLLKDYGITSEIKWPNDIYVGNKKICGILVEHVITGHEITRTIAGVGLNVNQKKFFSDAPNPISIFQISGKEFNVDQIAGELAELFEHYLNMTRNPGSLHSLFMENLWRNDGRFYPFVDKKTDEPILARIDSVASDGTLTLVTAEGEHRNYAFKEVEFTIDS